MTRQCNAGMTYRCLPCFRSPVVRFITALSIVVAAIDPGADAFGACRLDALHAAMGRIPATPGHASCTCPPFQMMAGGKDGGTIDIDQPRLFGSRRLHRWLVLKDFQEPVSPVTPERSQWQEVNNIFQTSLLVQASMTRTRIHEFAIGMTITEATKTRLDHGSLVEETIRNTGLAVECTAVDENGDCLIWTPEDAFDECVPSTGSSDGGEGAKFLEKHLRGVPDVASLDRAGADVPSARARTSQHSETSSVPKAGARLR